MKELSDKAYFTIDRYIMGKMNEVEKLEFEEKVSIDKDLAEEVNLRRLIIESIKFKREQSFKDYIRRNSMVSLSNNIWGKKFTVFSAFLVIGTGIALFVFDPEGHRKIEPNRNDVPQELSKDTLDSGSIIID